MTGRELVLFAFGKTRKHDENCVLFCFLHQRLSLLEANYICLEVKILNALAAAGHAGAQHLAQGNSVT